MSNEPSVAFRESNPIGLSAGARSALVSIGGSEQAFPGSEQVVTQAPRSRSLLGMLTGIGSRGAVHACTGDVAAASELRVARLAAQGRSNVEIAQELYLSLKTIETHLSHAYSKIGLSGQGSRRRLAQAVPA